MTYRLAWIVLLLLSPWAAAEPIIGWRTDGTGHYPRANPPRVWAPDKNVIWSTKMPAMSVASPIIVEDRIFVCSEPCTLLCVNKADGKILWQKENSYKDLVIPADLQEKIDAERKADDALRAKQTIFSGQMTAVKKEVAGGKLSKEEAESKLKALKARFDEIEDQRKALTLAVRYREPGKNSVGGFSQCTPVCDGRRVFVGFGNGLVACYDLEGNRKWLRLIEHSTLTYHHGSSPVLVGDKLLVHYADLVALDVEDGSEAWRAKVPPNYGTSIHCKVAGEDVVVHPNGFLVRVRDGHVIADKMGSSGPNSPIVHDNVAYFIRNEARAVRLPELLRAPIKTKDLWKAKLTGGGYWFASPILHDGLVYGLSAQGILNVVENSTGKLVYDQRLEFAKGEVYASVTLAGGLLFISSDAGITAVVQPGREYKEVARNTLEPFRSTPVFEGSRMYLRGLKTLYCIGE